MLKLFVIVECDTCGEAFEPVAVSCDRNPSAWRYLAAELATRAEGSGWNLYRGAYLCTDCSEDMPCLPAE